ncbi:MAG: CU044_5270 family protein [Jatrophihabitans sp.]
MDELDHLAMLRHDVAEPSTETLASIRTRLDAQAVRPAVLTMRTRPRRPRPTHPLRRRAVTGLVAAAAVAAGAFALTGSTGSTTRDPGSPQAGAPGVRTAAPGPRSSAPARVTFVNASQLLDIASDRAQQAPSPILGAGQYGYVRAHRYSVTSIDDPPARGAYQFTEYTVETWTPADPLEYGYLRLVDNIAVDFPTKAQREYAAAGPGGISKRQVEWDLTKDGKNVFQAYPPLTVQPDEPQCSGCATASVWDIQTAAGIAALPRDPEKLRATLYRYSERLYAELAGYGKGDQFTVNDLAYNGATALLTSDLTPPDLRASLYQVAKTIPDIKLIGSLENYDGTRGVAIGRVDSFHVEHDLIFDPATLTYIGDRTIARAPSREYEVKAGTLLGYTAITTGVRGKPTLPQGSTFPK